MTQAQINSANKATLIEYIQKIEAEKETFKLQATNSAAIAGYFENVLLAIEKALIDAPFLNKEGKVFKKLMWVLTNFEVIKGIIEQISETVKAWRKQVDDILRQQREQQNQTVDQQPVNA